MIENRIVVMDDSLSPGENLSMVREETRKSNSQLGNEAISNMHYGGEVSMHLSVLMTRKITDSVRESVDEHLMTNGFERNDHGYHCTTQWITIEIQIETEPEKDTYWIYGPIEVLWFIPETEIALEAKYTEESYDEAYQLAKQLADIVRGVIYDHQVGVAYSSDGEPFETCGPREQLAEYGTGMEVLQKKLGSRIQKE
ncbi:MAG: hypothetical protein JXC33_01310 [Deltaproteobacteria bacterium]|nr:hypothetical protein [Deltaproteobacteria bacterium]